VNQPNCRREDPATRRRYYRNEQALCSSLPCKERLSAALFAILLFFLVVPSALGEHQEEPSSELVVVELQSRPAELLIPLILPHIRAGEVRVSGSGRQVIVGGTPSRVAEVLALIDTLDRPPRQLLISVAEGALGEEDGNLGTLSDSAAEVPKGADGRSSYRTRRRDLVDVEGSHADPKIHTRSREGSRYFQRIPVLEGEWASLYAGPSDTEGKYPMVLSVRYGVQVFADVTEPREEILLSVRALLLGDQVRVDVAFLQDGATAYDTARKQKRGTRTTLMGNLGQWLLISPSRPSTPSMRHGETALATAKRAKGTYPVWLHVDVINQ
jgi:hypothetical protein